MFNYIRGQVRPACLVAWRELRDQIRDWRIILPIIALTIFFPFLMNFTAKLALNFATRYGAPLIGERFVPFLLMVVGFFPITVSLVIALESFVGEKERGTIEPLLSSPLADWQLFLGKFAASVGAPLLASYLGIFVYLVGLPLQDIPLPDFSRLLQTILLTTVQAILMVSSAILISTQATSVRAANLMASFVIIPIAILIQGESVLMFWGNNQVLWLAVIAVMILAVLVVRVALAHFQRESLLGREIDVLNIRWIGRTFRRAFIGESTSVVSWYRLEVFSTIRRQLISIVIIIILGLLTVSMSYGWFKANTTQYADRITADVLTQNLTIDIGSLTDPISFTYILGHNIRAIVVIALLGLFSFGVLGAMFYILNIGIIGGLLGIYAAFGYSPIILSLVGILPHGVFELPALILSSAAILHIGFILVTPTAYKTLGETLIENLADWAKINIGIVIPLLIVAASIEAWITPILFLNYIRY